MRKISIITVSYNSSSTIRETIESVLSQDYPNIEYIIVDGLSTDGTVEIVKSFGKKIDQFTSEKDSGLYDAMNKAITMATGDVVGILNSDDLYFNSNVLTDIMNEFGRSNSDCVYGDLFYFDTKQPDRPLRYYKGKNFSPSKISIGILPPHPTFFVKKSIYQKFGTFDTQFKYAADFDLMARFLYVNRISYSYIPKTLVKMRTGGLSTQGLKRIIEINREDIASCKKNNIKTNLFLFHLKYIFKIFYITHPRYFFKAN
jgi:glycosyltransferase involved in cell wall biosynthesis